MNKWIAFLCVLALACTTQAYAGKRAEGAVLGFIGGYFVGKHVEKNRRPPPARRVVVVARSPIEQSFKSQTRYVRKQIQSQLKQDGFYRSYIDGYWGRGTRTALENFATDSGKTHLLTTHKGANELMSMLLSPEESEQVVEVFEPEGADSSTEVGSVNDLDDIAGQVVEQPAPNPEDTKKKLKIADQQLSLLKEVLRVQNSGEDQTPFNTAMINALDKRISVIQRFRDQAALDMDAGMGVPLPSGNLAGSKVSNISPIIPYYLLETDEVGEMHVTPRVNDSNIVVYDMDIREPGAGFGNTRETISVQSDGADDLMGGLQKAHEWSDVAQRKGIHQKHEKMAACFPKTACGGSLSVGSAHEVIFMLFKDGSTAARIQKSADSRASGYNLSIESALLLSAYLDYMKRVGEYEYTAGSMSNAELDSVFK